MKRYLFAAVAGISLTAAAPAFADHNSLFGEGTGLDPRGVQNNRYDTLADGEEMSQFRGATVDAGTSPQVVPQRAAPAIVDLDLTGGRGFGGGIGGGAGAGGRGGR